MLGELTETAINFIPDQRLPSFVSAIAARLLLILNDPLHLLYEKSNDLLNRGPRWDVERLPAFWINQILLRPPTSHGRYDDEADWLIETFLEGLQSPEVRRPFVSLRESKIMSGLGHGVLSTL